jgi:hypothetical protein
MFTFWTVTSETTHHTNDRSSRYGTEKAAIHEATTRIQGGRNVGGVYILKAVKFVRAKPAPEIEVIEIDV